MTTERISYKEAYDNRSVPVQIAGKQDKLKPQNGIYINDDDEIGLYGIEFGGYEAGRGIEIDQNVISSTVEPGVTTEEMNTALATKQDYSMYIRKIYIGTDEVPSNSVGEDGDLYIYRPE